MTEALGSLREINAIHTSEERQILTASSTNPLGHFETETAEDV
jgi:hypothetical protein